MARVPPVRTIVSLTATVVSRRVLAANQRWRGSQSARTSDGGVLDAIAEGARLPALQAEPVKAVRAEGEKVGRFRDGREARVADQLYGDSAPVTGQVEVNRLGAFGEVGHDQDRLVLVLPQEGQDVLVQRP